MYLLLIECIFRISNERGAQLIKCNTIFKYGHLCTSFPWHLMDVLLLLLLFTPVAPPQAVDDRMRGVSYVLLQCVQITLGLISLFNLLEKLKQVLDLIETAEFLSYNCINQYHVFWSPKIKRWTLLITCHPVSFGRDNVTWF